VSVEQLYATPSWPASKIKPPRPRVLVSRQRLIDSLHIAVNADYSTALIVAPGGTGKTVLLADWASQARIPVAWYTLDAADRDPRRLVTGLCAAVEQVFPGIAEQSLATLAGGALEAAASGLLLSALEGMPLVIVLDDFHHLADHPEALALWDHVLRFRPSSLRFVLLSRVVPFLGFSSLASLEQLTGVGSSDLRFDDDEAADLLAAHGLDSRSAAQFTQRSGGWAAGVLLLARAEPNGMRFLRARAEMLMEYLGREILDAQPPDLRVFMLESAALGSTGPEATDAILDRQNSVAYYAEVAARGLFLEHNDGLYRYHDLFAEYLVGTLKAQDSARLEAIHRAAAAWWVAHDDLPRALGLLATNEDWEALAKMLDRERATLWTRGLGGTVLLHVDRLPAEYRTPRLLTLCGYARSQRGEHAAALALADVGMARAESDEEWLSPALLRVESLVQAWRDEDAVRAATAALTVAHRANLTAAVTHLQELRGIAWLRSGYVADGQGDLIAALTVHRRERDENGEARTLFNLATQLIGAGHAQDTEDYLVRADMLWRRVGNVAVKGNILHTRALLLRLTGDHVGACQEAEHAKDVAQESCYPLIECEALVALAHIHADLGHAAEAERHSIAAMDMAARLDLADVLNNAFAARISAALLRRDRAGACQLIGEARSLAETAADNAVLDLLDGTLALRSRAHQRAAKMLARAAEDLESVARPHEAARAYLLCSEALLMVGAVRRAEDALNRVANLILPLGSEGYLKPFIRFTHQAMANRRVLRRLHRDTRLMLERMVETTPQLSLLPSVSQTAAEPTLWLSPFGQGAIKLGSRKIDISILAPKAREMLFFAGCTATPLNRGILLDALWDGDTRAAHALWNASRDIRRVLGESSWGTHSGRYALRLPVEDEGQRFDAMVARVLDNGATADRIKAGEEVLEIVGHGGYLEWCDSSWVTAKRNYVIRQTLAVTLTLARLYTDESRRAEAITVCLRAAAFDPLNEEPRLALVRYLIADGQYQAARDEYRSYRRLLRKELSIEPSAALRTLALSASSASA